MIPFLKNVAQAYYKEYGQQVSDFTFVFPNRRAGIFFQKYLAELARKPIFSPEILTVANLFVRLSNYKTADRIELLFSLYDIYKRISQSTETFDEFLFWGEMILNDFDDIDKYMGDAGQLFRNIYDLKEIDAGFSYFTADQIAAIRRFWINFIPIDNNEGKKKEFLEMWEVLFEMYTSLRDNMSAKGLAYEGMIFRDVATRAKAGDDFGLPFRKLVFVGLNAHSKSEEMLLSYFARLSIADFYWDYSSELVKDPMNRASTFIDKNKMLFRSQLSLAPEEMTLGNPSVKAIGIPSSVGQAKYVHEILKTFIADGTIASEEDALKTAIVLPDENLLLPVLYSIPQEIEKINVTMGYNLSNSSVAGLMDYIFNIQRNIRHTADGEKGFYFRFVLSILSHKYLTKIAEEEVRTLRKDIVQNNKSVVPYDMLKVHPLLELIFKPIDDWTQIAEYLQSILAKIQASLYTAAVDGDSDQSADTHTTDLEREFIIEYYKTINKMEEALKKVSAEMKPETYFKLLKKLVVGISVPFTGEPLSGLQIMGMLETRALDFENLIILSMNEGIFPQRKAANSFIPYNLRKGFGLPTYEHQDAIFSYHFYRLINRAKQIYILHDTRTEGMQTGEVSRYFNQLKYLYGNKFDIEEKLAVYEVASTESETITIHKDESVLEKLKLFTTGERSLSASAINMYLDCPLQFYFSVVQGLKEEDEVAETVEADTFGSIFHSVMEWLYEPFEGKMITADLLHKIRKDEGLLTKTIERSFAKNYFKTDENKPRKLTGQNYLTGEVIRRYVKKVIRTDAKLTPFNYVQSEKRLKQDYQLPSGLSVSLKGFIDRIDEVSGRTRIIDYKTGKGLLQFKSMEQVFDKEIKDRPKAVMQVFMYAHLYLDEYPSKIVEPGIYFLRNLFDERFDADVIYRPSSKDRFRVEDFADYRQEFKTHFDACLTEIFDRDINFTQTPTEQACQWCAFANICKR